ncbi:DUF3828 domain-containing protein [Lelliottia amnigena]|uniref:DUF3828 domain-containing protein n=1 Tax=Lelliottia amnigena TaxID=61646 RepID=A0AAP2F130_LELAM|nr:DUF3828 domain-containing protein [Lelliottia amnigena]MBL5898201.1 DUF3828 domain-containing protein [Lelliottia amnigena]MBL5933992.1 DUF3828 domain-containing protein [Lelliottia amnigena]MCU7782025.1 YbjP/YqhG family protein [Lelliottia amnigena]TCD19716.1 DUF3828 domain-containing protein [Lelliottia amnigena]
MMRILSLFFTVFMLVACAKSPEQQTKAFYQWYIKGASLPENALFYASPELRRWVSRSTFSRLQREYYLSEEVNNFDADYFTYTQDLADNWPDNIIVSPAYHVPGGVAVNVMLGTWDESDWQVYLVVYLVQEDGIWKIARVKTTTYEQNLP